jgi:peptidoglycan/xylan/chitin deacetylase (PgdA/CDA1 family)
MAKSKARSAKPKRPSSRSKKRSPKPVTTTAEPVLALPAQAISLLEQVDVPSPAPRLRDLVPQGLALAWAAGALLVAAALLQNISAFQADTLQPLAAQVRDSAAFSQLRTLSTAVVNLQNRQDNDDVSLVSAAPLDQLLSNIKIDLESDSTKTARQEMATLKQQLSDDQAKLAAAEAAAQAAAVAAAAAKAEAAAAARVTIAPSFNVPILIYHKPPSDFAAQMAILVQRNYTSITLDSLVAAMNGHGSLPAKPVIITFDDGFSDQEDAVPVLEQHQLRATFFIIDGGQASNYCIGANRIPQSCGDSYLTWDQVRQLDQNPLFTIASHTVDHLDLAQQSEDVQRFQIFTGKQELEQEIGHSVDDFAYPYGDYNATTLSMLQQAGFVAAVTTTPSTEQTAAGALTLGRIRDTYNLP